MSLSARDKCLREREVVPARRQGTATQRAPLWVSNVIEAERESRDRRNYNEDLKKLQRALTLTHIQFVSVSVSAFSAYRVGTGGGTTSTRYTRHVVVHATIERSAGFADQAR